MSVRVQAQLSSEQRRQESLQRLDNIARLAGENLEIGSKTLTALERDEEIIREQQREMAKVEDDLNQAERELKSVGSFWQMVANWFRPDNSHDHQDAFIKTENKRMENRERLNAELAEGRGKIASAALNSQGVPFKNDYTSGDERDVFMEQDKYLDDILLKVRDMKSQGRTMNVSLSDNNERLDSLAQQVDESQMRARKLATKAEKILKNL